MNKENDKYFIPDVEDIRVGYECYWIKDPSKDIEEDNLLSLKLTPKQVAFALFPPVNWERETTDNFVPDLRSYRTLYLTKEQIEQEGWKETSTAGFFDHIGDDRFFVSWYPDVNWINIGDDQSELGYAGEIKSINEFRYICKLLKI